MNRNTVIFILLTAFLVVLFAVDICSGSIWLSPFGSSFSALEKQILIDIRLPKALTAIIAGIALSIAGLMMQTLFRNPLAGPYTLGISSGANLLSALYVQEKFGKKNVVTVFADDNKKYLSTDYSKVEPVKEGFISSDVELISFEAVR